MPRLLIPALLALAALAFVACDDGNGDGPPTATVSSGQPPTATAPAGASPTASEPTPEGPFEGGRDPVEVGDDGGGIGLLADVRAAAHEDFDRIVFEFDGARPGYRVQYVDTAIACGSGETVDVDGAVLVEVHMTPAAAHDDAGQATFPLQELTPGLTALTAAVQTCDFEADVTWVLGLTHEAAFAVSDLTDPFRIVVDVAHP